MPAPHHRRRFGPVLVFGVSGLALVLGTWGFLEAENAPQSWTSALYLALQLFTLESGAVPGATPWPLEVARWLAPAALAGGIFAAVRAYFGSRLDRWRVRRLSGHFIVCGLGEKGLALAGDLLSAGKKVVAIDPAPDSGHVERLRAQGGLHLPIPGGEESFRAAAATRACALVAVTGSDTDNLALALAASRLAAASGRTGDALRIFTHIGKVEYRDLLDRNDFLATHPGEGSVVRTFNYHANLARLLLARHPLETAGFDDGSVNRSRQVHLVLPDLGPAAAAVALHAARIGHYLGDRRVHVHVVTPRAASLVRAFGQHYPGFAHSVASFEAVAIDEPEDFGQRAAALVADRPADCWTVLPTFSDNPDGIGHLLRLHEAASDEFALRIPVPGGLKPLLEESRAETLLRRLVWFPGHGDCAGLAAVFKDQVDLHARRLHDTWYGGSLRRIEAAEARGDHTAAAKLRAKPAFHPWEELSEELKDSNRSQADHFPVKVRAAGQDPGSVGAGTWKAFCEANPDLLEDLARMEHERWSAQARLAGWTHAPQRDDARKRHDNLVPYEALDEGTKDYDRSAVVSGAD